MAIVWYLSSIQFSGKTMVSGVLLKKKPLISSPGNSPLGNALMIIGSFFNSAWSNKNIMVQLRDKSLNIKTNENGGFNVSFDFCSDEEVLVFPKNSNEALKIIQNYPLQFNKTDSNISIISDIDETIMVSYTKTKLKRFLITLFKPSEKRKVIPFTQELYNIYKDNDPRFFYVSKSENNLFPTISNFILHNKLPKGKLFLTPYLSFWQLINSKKDKNFKFKVITSIIKNSPEQKFVLIGDDSQRDMEIYTKIAHLFKSSIEHIYIRQTGRKINSQKMRNWKILQETGLDAYYFKPDEIFALIPKTTSL